jgi:hypothetical protein
MSSQINQTYSNEAFLTSSKSHEAEHIYSQAINSLRTMAEPFNNKYTKAPSDAELDSLDELLEKLTGNQSNMTIAEGFLKKYA